MFAETLTRLGQAMPRYWQKVQYLAASLAVAAFTALQFESALSPGAAPWLRHAFTAGLAVALTAQLTVREPAAVSPTAALEARLATLTPPAPPAL